MYTDRVKAPKGERIWVSYNNYSYTPLFVITSKISSREYYYLYEVAENLCLKKIGRARSPNELEERFNIKEQIKIESR